MKTETSPYKRRVNSGFAKTWSESLNNTRCEEKAGKLGDTFLVELLKKLKLGMELEIPFKPQHGFTTSYAVILHGKLKKPKNANVSRNVDTISSAHLWSLVDKSAYHVICTPSLPGIVL